jgi:hypothetical protein
MARDVLRCHGRDGQARLAQVNGGLGIVVDSRGEPVAALVLDVAGGVVRTVHLVANPEKLAGVRAPGMYWGAGRRDLPMSRAKVRVASLGVKAPADAGPRLEPRSRRGSLARSEG